MDARVSPEGSLEILSQVEISKLRDAGEGGLYDLWRQCSLAILNSGADDDDVRRMMRSNKDFRISVIRQDGGIALEIENAPDSAFVMGQMIRGMREQLFAVMRDLLYAHDDVLARGRFDLNESHDITDAVFHILRNARVLLANAEPKLVVCWGGHAISRSEYDYSKQVGYALGLRELDVCTGCGAGAMKGPMKGAALGHAKQRLRTGRYVGLTEPTIIAAEPPNPIVNELVILPDMEKRLEAFVRLAHAIVVFPGGVGTAEEILYLLGVLLNERNAPLRVPLVFTGPRESAGYFDRMDAFIAQTLGTQAQSLYEVIVGDYDAAAEFAFEGVQSVRAARDEFDEPYFFNWRLNIGIDFQRPFDTTHESMSELALHPNQPVGDLAVNLRRAFSGIVAGNVRESGIRQVEEHGPFELNGDDRIIACLDRLLRDFVAEGRMRLSHPENYVPCYRIAS
jgi:predicted Rossmann-fold nucleotide-binding protein